MAASPASMLKIVTSGLQDRERLQPPRGQPNIGFYKRVHIPRTRFAVQWQRVDFDNAADFGRKAVVTLPILGELITRATLVVVLPDLVGTMTAFSEAGVVAPQWYWTNSVGHAIIEDMRMTINEQPIDILDGRLMEVLDDQEQPVEHWDTTNALLNRDPSEFPPATATVTTSYNNQQVEIVPPFWWNRGVGPEALPIQALYKDRVQISVTFRPVQECVYTTTRPGGNIAAEPRGVLPQFAGGNLVNGDGDVVATMPRDWHFRDAYWIVEYVSLEDREAAAFRKADLQFPIAQHIAVQPFNTNGTSKVRIPIKEGGLVRDMTWVAQRTEAPSYNAWFLFSKELGPTDASGNQQIAWPDAQIPDWNYGQGYGLPAFANTFTSPGDPITSATLWYRGKQRFDHDGPSLFRSLIPALGSMRTPLINRYIYRYDFGFWPTGGLADALHRHAAEVRGAANWDLIPKRELGLTMNTECSNLEWVTVGETQEYVAPCARDITVDFPLLTEAFYFEITGGTCDVSGGAGATVSGYVDYQKLRRLPGFQALMVRVVPNGSAALVVRKTGGEYEWLAVAGAGGCNGIASSAGDVLQIGARGDGVRTHDASGGYGGGGGGWIAGSVGLPDGVQMPTNNSAFVMTLQSTGGSGNAFAGGDGYWGGGSGSVAGGGGGSYVSPHIMQVTSSVLAMPTNASAKLTPVGRKVAQQPNFDIYVWLTRYNMMRVTAGRGAVLFSS